MKLPTELMDNIFKLGESNPSNVRSFGKLMSMKTKQQMLSCKKVIDTRDLKKVRLLKFHNSKCTHNDLLYSIEKEYYDIAKYIQNAYPEARIKYDDILRSIMNNDSEFTNKLLEVYKYSNKQEYVQLFSLHNTYNKKMMKVILDRRPNKDSPLKLSTLFEDDLNFFTLTLNNDYLKNFMSVAKNIIIDDNFIAKLLRSREFIILDTLFKYQRNKINRTVKNNLLREAEENMAYDILYFMEKNKDIF